MIFLPQHGARRQHLHRTIGFHRGSFVRGQDPSRHVYTHAIAVLQGGTVAGSAGIGTGNVTLGAVPVVCYR